MAKRAQRRSAKRDEEPPPPPPYEPPPGDDMPPPPGTTGRFLVLFERGAAAGAPETLSRLAGLSVASSLDFAGGVAASGDMGGADAVMFPDLGICVTTAPPEQTRLLGVAAAETGILAVEPERIVYVSGSEPPGVPELPGLPGMPDLGPASAASSLPLDYLRGYRDAVNALYEKLSTGGEAEAEGEVSLALAAEAELTWGLQATRVAASQFTGKGIRVAVLDTGMDVGHPDFVGRVVRTASFISGQSVQDGHGHGTHCIGTSCGPKRPQTLPRYGVAHEAEIFAGKVLSNAGSGGDAGILAGIQWAIDNKCPVVSMSLGGAVQPGQSFSQVFEHAARRALLAGTLVIAAAGNDSRRPQTIRPVSHPANCPSIMAVAAVDRNLRIASFSNGGLNPQGGQVDIAGPGVSIRSSWPRPTLYRTIDGTSMATPHVAGIAALYAQSDASFRGRVLMSMLTQMARRLSAPARDVGAGLVQAI
jgi:subtilisin